MVPHEGDVIGMVVIGGVGLCIGKVHGKTEVEIGLGADLAQLLELIDAGDVGQDEGLAQKFRFLG